MILGIKVGALTSRSQRIMVIILGMADLDGILGLLKIEDREIVGETDGVGNGGTKLIMT